MEFMDLGKEYCVAFRRMKHEIDMPNSRYFEGYFAPRQEKTASEKDEKELLTLFTIPSIFSLKLAPDMRIIAWSL
jgi:hypothetical protein